MKIIGQAWSAMGGRKLDHVLEAARRRANGGDKKVSTSGVSMLANGTDIATIALQKNRAAWGGTAECHLGVCSIPASTSFPDGKIYSGRDKL
jgi:hypothetical protein